MTGEVNGQGAGDVGVGGSAAATGGATSAGGSGSGDVGAGSGNQGAAEKPWHGIEDPTVADYVKNKGWQGPADVVKSYMGAEKLIGRSPDQLLVLPRADDPEGMKAVFQKLGLPDSPTKYDMKVGLPKEAQIDEGFASNMQQVLHKANVTEGQAKTLVAEYNGLLAQQQEQAAKDYELNVQADKQALLDEWKGGHDRMMNRAKTAAQSLGFTPELIDAVEKHVGYAKTYKMFAEIGAKLGEDGFVSAAKGAGFESQLTPAEAKAQFDNLRADPNHVKALMDKSHPGHKLAQEKENKFFAIMYPDGK